MNPSLNGPTSTAASRAAAKKAAVKKPVASVASVTPIPYVGNYGVLMNGMSSTNAKLAAANAILADGMSSQEVKDIAQNYVVTHAPEEDAGGGGGENETAVGGSGTVYPDLSGAIAILRENINGLDPIYQAEVENAIKAYETANNERIAKFNETKATSDASEVTNDQNVLTSRNAINKNMRMSTEDIMSILGSLGMSGSTTNKALNVIADTGNTNTNEANFGWGKNKQSILQSWNDYVGQDENQQKQIDDAKAANIAKAGINRATAKKDYLGQIASNKVNMGQFDTNDILGEMAAANGEIAGLSTVPQAYKGITPTYTAPAISTLLGQNMTKFDVAPGTATGKSAPKIVKVNEQTGNGSKYGIL